MADDKTTNLQLPYIMASQAQKHVTHNEALALLDAVVQLSVKSRDLAAPPVGPVEGDRYIVAAGATGDWTGKTGQIAFRQDGRWLFVAPGIGWQAWLASENSAVFWSGLGWKSVLPNVLTDFAVSLLPDSGRFAGNAAKTEALGAAAFAFPSYLTLYNGSTAANGGKFITNNNDYGGASGALDPEIRKLVDMIRDAGFRRYGVEFYAAQITHGSGVAGSPVNVGGTNYYYSSFLTFGPRAPRMTFHCYLRALDAPIVHRWIAGHTFLKNGVRSKDHVVITPAEGWVSLTVLDEQEPRASIGYNPTPYNMYAAQSGHRYLMACPALMGGLTSIDDNVGVIAGINRWLP